MGIVTFPAYIRCTFNSEKPQGSQSGNHKTEVFFAQNKDFSEGYSFLEKYINSDDQLKVAHLKKSNDRSSTLAYYTMLRLILSRWLKIKPEDLSYFTFDRGKPGIKNYSLNFNISHSGDAFAFAISENAGLGMDLEEHKKDFNYKAVIKRFFGAAESRYILSSPELASERFFLLWTRKEALLKAFGTGIISDLSQVEVHRPLNKLSRNFLDEFTDITVFDDYYIYSLHHSGYYLSVALPEESDIIFTQLDEEYFQKYFR